MSQVDFVRLPQGLVRARIEMHGDDGVAWLGRLPSIVADCARQWSLSLDPPFPHVAYNYVAPGVRADGSPVVLKVCYPDSEYLTEVDALRLFDGLGASRLLAVDVGQSALLVERLIPGTSLHTVTDDPRATDVALDVMRRLWRPAPRHHRFPSFSDWVTRMARLAPDLVERHSAFPAHWIHRALQLFAELTVAPADPVVLHGDLHHGNVLRAEREPWLAIDPKGVIGEPVCETGPLLLNALPDDLDPVEIRPILGQRVVQMAERLGVERGRARDWGVVRAVLSGFWSLEGHGHGWERAIVCAEALSSLDA